LQGRAKTTKAPITQNVDNNRLTVLLPFFLFFFSFLFLQAHFTLARNKDFVQMCQTFLSMSKANSLRSTLTQVHMIYIQEKNT
jgi:Na+/H+ antiporter NhaC